MLGRYHGEICKPTFSNTKFGSPVWLLLLQKLIPTPQTSLTLAALSPTQTPVRFRCRVPEVALSALASQMPAVFHVASLVSQQRSVPRLLWGHRKKGTAEGTAFLRTVLISGWMPGQGPAA